MCVVCVFCNMSIAFQTFCLATYLRSILNCIHPLLFYVFNERHILNSVYSFFYPRYVGARMTVLLLIIGNMNIKHIVYEMNSVSTHCSVYTVLF